MKIASLFAASFLFGAASLEGPRGTLVATNMRDNTATVIDLATESVLATLSTGEAPHEVATSHDGRWAVVSNYGIRERPGSSLTVIDLRTPAVARTIELGEYRRPHGVRFFPGDTVVAVTSEASRAVLLVDFRDGHVIGTVPTNGRGSHMIAMSAAGDELFTTNIPDGSITRLDVAKREAKRVIPVAKFVEGIAITPDGKQVWVGSNGDIEKDSLVPTAEVPGSPSPEGVTISPDSRWAFVTLQGRNRVVTIDLARGRIVGMAPTGTWSDGVAYSPVEHG